MQIAPGTDNATAKPTRRAFSLLLVPTPDGPDELGRTPADRMRHVLKRLLRDHGLRCVALSEDRINGEPEQVETTEP